MSGLEIAGVILGTFPLLVSALEHYKDGKGALASLLRSRGQLDALIRRLKLQHKLFYVDVLHLLRGVGIEEVVIGDLTEEECIAILRDPKNTILVGEYLGNVYGTFLEILRRYESYLKMIAGKLGHIKRSPNADKNDLNAILACNSAGFISFKEKVSFTMRRDSLMKLVDDLSEDRLSIRYVIRREPNQSSQASHTVIKSLERVQQAAASLYSALCNTCTCFCEKHQVLIRLEYRRSLQSKANIPITLPSEIIFSILIESGGKLHRASIEASIQPLTDGINIAQERLGNKAQFDVPTSTTESAGILQKKEQVTNICETLRDVNITGRDLKLELVDTKLLDIRDSGGDLNADKSLYDVLAMGLHDEYLRLTPKQQIMLAVETASSILQLRQTVWLSSGLTSKCMKLLMSPGDPARGNRGPEGSANRSYLGSKAMLGFADGPDTKSLLLDLVILLLEIWHHTPLELWAKSMGLQVMDSAKSRLTAAIRWLEDTSSHIPHLYLDAIEQCLAFCSGRIRVWEDSEFQKQYWETILLPLQESCKAWGMEHVQERTNSFLGDMDDDSERLENSTSQELADVPEAGNETLSTVPSTSHPRSAPSELASTFMSSTVATSVTGDSEQVFARESIKPPLDNMEDAAWSIASDSEEIGSQTSIETSSQAMTGKALLGLFLVKEEATKELIQEAAARMDKERLIQNLRRLLKSFYKNLLVEADTETKRYTARLLRSRRGRLRISGLIADRIQQDNQDESKVDYESLTVSREDKIGLEHWLEGAEQTSRPPLADGDMMTSEETENQISSDETESDSDTDTQMDFPQIANYKTYLRESNAMKGLQRELMLMFLPIEVRDVLSTVPNKDIWISRDQDLSVCNGAKAWVEDKTRLRWNWWPLAPRKRPLLPNEARMGWKCVSCSTNAAKDT
ncbi:hypothetical protein PG991_002910 [Apiospora marii]|uniref:DUF7580 domain-containing protein n=1 Tax=Apiospora marii TaxID=335849 RepID=A0ABR1SGQ4_9PEZI